jgi:uncharacterized protein (TIGR03435 family)
MKTKSIFVYMIVGLVGCVAAPTMFSTANAITPQQAAQQVIQTQGAPQAAKAPPQPTMIGPTPPTPQEKALALAIAKAATANCGGKDADAAPDCRIKELWKLAQCPPAEVGAAVPVCDPPPGEFEYEVATIKPHKDEGNNGGMIGQTPDGYRSINIPMQNTVMNAYSTGLQMEIAGAPGWLNDLHYDIEAKFVPEVADALKKLTPEDRQFVRRYMMQQLLKERTNLAVHLETKEVPAYDMVVAKNGLKLKEADPTSKENGSMSVHSGDQGKTVLVAKGMQLANLARSLSGGAGRPIFDKTGLTGIYDINLTYAHEQSLSASAPDGSGPGTGPTMPADPSGPGLIAALEEQLGLKLVPSRGPKMVLVIEHIDKPDAN